MVQVNFTNAEKLRRVAAPTLKKLQNAKPARESARIRAKPKGVAHTPFNVTAFLSELHIYIMICHNRNNPIPCMGKPTAYEPFRSTPQGHWAEWPRAKTERNAKISQHISETSTSLVLAS